MKAVFAFLAVFLASLNAFAAEEILSFDSFADVQKDASAVIVEKIAVRAEGKRIKRGIYRDLPTAKGERYRVLSVSRETAVPDGEDAERLTTARGDENEAYFTEFKNGYLRINTGSDAFLEPDNVYVFTIVYQVFNAVRPFKDYDEFYWNATGNGWEFPIKKASAFVRLPDGAPVLQKAVYVGGHGSRERGLISGDMFIAPRALEAGEGLTFAVGFQKGFVTFPPALVRALPYILAGAVLILYMGLTWHLYGRDPAKPEVMPRFSGVPHLTAAQSGYVYFRGLQNKRCLSAALIENAVGGYLKMTEIDKDTLTFSKKREAVSKEEKFFARKFPFAAVASDKPSKPLRTFYKEFSRRLKTTAGDAYFSANYLFVGIGAALAGAGVLWLAHLAGDVGFGLALLIFVPFLYAGFLRIRAHVVFGTLWTLIILLNCLSVTWIPVAQSEPLRFVLIFYLAALAALGAYAYLIYRPTRRGQEVVAHLDGLKMFMTAVHQDMPKDVTFDKMEKLLPYAVLFGIEKQWCEKMKKVADTFDYQPDWYGGRPFSSSKLGAFDRTLAASCASPSSSGSGGRGFSGGGFGGGGGGGR